MFFDFLSVLYIQVKIIKWQTILNASSLDVSINQRCILLMCICFALIRNEMNRVWDRDKEIIRKRKTINEINKRTLGHLVNHSIIITIKVSAWWSYILHGFHTTVITLLGKHFMQIEWKMYFFAILFTPFLVPIIIMHWKYSAGGRGRRNIMVNGLN